MHPQSTQPKTQLDLTAATGLLRRLYAAGWRPDTVTPRGVGSTTYTLTHPTGREIASLVDRDGHVAELILTGLTLDQAVDAVTGAGLAPAESTLTEPAYMSCPRQCGVDVREHNSSDLVDGKCDTEPDYWLTLAADLRQAADRLATLAGTRPPVKAQLAITGAYPGNTDRAASALTDTVAAALGVNTHSHAFPAGDSVYKADRDFGKIQLQVATYLPAEQSELERLRARNAELESQLAEGGTTRQGVDPIDRRDLANDPWRCPSCHHEAEHRHDTGCAARKDGVRCGCTKFIGGAR